jgi:hypothetical protein
MSRAALAAVALFLLPIAAEAQDDPKRADALFDEGLKLLDQGRIAEACDRLRESRKIASGIGVTLYLADCEERVGHWIAARELYREGQTMAAAKHDPRESNARERADALAARMPSIQVRTSGEAQPIIEIDGEKADTLPRDVDPGKHVVRARTPERNWERAVDVPAKKTLVTVDVPALDVEPAPAPRGITFFTPLRIAGVASAGTGVVLLSFGLALGADAISKLGASNDAGHCGPGNRCDTTGIALRSSADASATASTALFFVGLVGIAVGATLFFLAPKLSRTKGAASGFVALF